MSESIVVPTDRDVRGTLDEPTADACVVACPPHPRMGGDRTDSRLRAVSDAVDAACLRFDYGPWDDGYGELADARAALSWARDRYGADRVAMFGYSFGGCIALLASARDDPVAVSTLAPVAKLTDELDGVSAIGELDCPLQLVYGSRDTTADWEPALEAARKRGATIEELPADHFFVGRTADVGRIVAAFLEDALG